MMGAFSKSVAPRILLNYQTLADLTNIYRLLQSLRRRRLSVMQAASNTSAPTYLKALLYRRNSNYTGGFIIQYRLCEDFQNTRRRVFLINSPPGANLSSIIQLSVEGGNDSLHP